MTMPSVSVSLAQDNKTSLDNAVGQGMGDTDAIINRALETHFAVLAENEAVLKDRISEAKAGKWIDSDTMMQWVESIGTENEIPEPVAI